MSVRNKLKSKPQTYRDGYLFAYEKENSETKDLASIEEHRREERQKRINDNTPLL